MAYLVFGLPLLVLIPGALFYGQIFPWWMIGHCVDQRSGKPRAAWMSACIVLWSIGAILYGIWGSGVELHRKIAVRGAVFFIISPLLVWMCFIGWTGMPSSARMTILKTGQTTEKPLSADVLASKSNSYVKAFSNPAISVEKKIGLVEQIQAKERRYRKEILLNVIRYYESLGSDISEDDLKVRDVLYREGSKQ